MRRQQRFLAVAVLILPACGRNEPTALVLPEEPRKMTIRLTSPAFQEGAMLPKVYTCDGKGISPPLSWTGAPESARSLSLICEDPDAPSGTFTHWVFFNIPADVSELKEGIPPEAQVKLGSGGTIASQGKNNFGKIGYGGPCPPGGTHRYIFRLYALDARLDLKSGTTREPLLRVMKGHVLAEGRLMGKYSR